MSGPPRIPTTTLLAVVLLFGGVAGATSDDGDGVPDSLDNCSERFNPPPFDCDTDLDGYGNACDGDFDQDFSVNALDVAAHFLPDFQAGVDSGTGTDMDCNGSVNANDLELFFLPQSVPALPGPSGLPCAGTVPCTP